MSKLTDTQMILLSTASQRVAYSLYPLPETLRTGTNVSKAIAGLTRASFAEEREAEDTDTTSRIDGDMRYGMFATSDGLQAVGIGPAQQQPATKPQHTLPAVEPRISKAASVLDLLRREAGATLPDLIAATGWLPHTTRAALTGLRKKGHAIERFKRNEVTTYRIAR